MSNTTRHLRVGILATLISLVACSPLQAIAATAPVFTVTTTPKIFITEMQTSADTASQEFIELYNNSDTDIDLADNQNAGKTPWKLQFFSANSTIAGQPDWTKPSASLSLTGTILAHDYFLLSSIAYAPGGIDADQNYSPRLSDTGGGIQLVTASATATIAYSRLMWRQPITGQGLPASVMPTPVANGSLQRLPNDNNEYINADNSLTDFATAAMITPKDVWEAPVAANDQDQGTQATAEGSTAAPDPTIVDTTTVEPVVTDTPGADTGAIDNTGLDTPYLTELLPNPSAPQTDAHDEFIELYNPNDAPFDLKGYSLEVGTTTLHVFTFTGNAIIEPRSYRAFYSADTGLALANSGGQARLLDSTGKTVSQTESYSAASEGAAWVLDSGTWQWSTSSTPNAFNSVTVPPVAVKSGAKVTASKVAAAKTTPKKVTAKTASTKIKGTSSTKTAKAKKTTAKKSSKPKVSTVADTEAITPTTPIHTQVLVLVAALAVLYAGYEYRSDLSNKFFQFRRNRTLRRILRK